jgi:hypothetical protein
MFQRVLAGDMGTEIARVVHSGLVTKLNQAPGKGE